MTFPFGGNLNTVFLYLEDTLRIEDALKVVRKEKRHPYNYMEDCNFSGKCFIVLYFQTNIPISENNNELKKQKKLHDTKRLAYWHNNEVIKILMLAGSTNGFVRSDLSPKPMQTTFFLKPHNLIFPRILDRSHALVGTPS